MDAEGKVKKKKKRKQDPLDEDGHQSPGELTESEKQPKVKKQRKAPSEERLQASASLIESQALLAENAAEKGIGGTGKLLADGKNQPVLPWMRLPIKIEAGQGVPLEDVRGLDSRLQDALKACEHQMLGSLSITSTCMQYQTPCQMPICSFKISRTGTQKCRDP